ncbi:MULTISPECIES: glycerol-3-phosphate dehydrogenase/oxidase [unclassified Comamonas]|uniref:glycerol-3-phosphate dehydrogenase/oxidase n=1 Tax=unclassified Comamonas TaxID=2638500 RepID=UPI000A83CA64|nr:MULTISPECIES: glycerol-3-phosphate dehydrogenase/oxidase [unclassified Comamonas]MBN9328980.1 glycerol-3-phosphate dehydrogenase/oxidase [Comamonas sp.]
MGRLSDAPQGAFPPREATLARLGDEVWDLLVIGGGISGAGVAQQAAQAGWRVLLAEQRDFAWGASSRSSKLVHGGLRYLKQGDLKTTLHAVRERERLLREAPALVRLQSFLWADCARRPTGRWLMQAGLMVYDRMARQHSHHRADLAATQWLAPGLAPPGLRGSLVFHDASTDDARLVLRVLQEARQQGAVTLNDLGVRGVHGQGGGFSVQLHDALTGREHTVRARCVVNTTGAWGDRLRGAGRTLLRPLRGSHLIVPFWRLPVAQAISFMHPADGRPVFFYPWEGATLIGTTDLDHGDDLDQEARISAAEARYLLDAVNGQFPDARLTAADVLSCFSGVRPVIADGHAQASRATREHLVRDEGGFITLAGGKLTTFRLMAQDALALAARHVGRAWTASDAPVFQPASRLNPALSPAVQARLQARYGNGAGALCAGATAAQLERIAGTPTLWIELRVAARHEAVHHLDDLLLRRTRLGLLLPRGGEALLDQVQALCAPALGWSPARWDQERQRYRALIARHYQLPDMGQIGLQPLSVKRG